MHALRLRQCALMLRWTLQRLANELRCDLAYIYALQAGSEELPPELCRWIEKSLQGFPDDRIPAPVIERGKATTTARQNCDEQAIPALKLAASAIASETFLYKVRLDQLKRSHHAQHPALRRSEADGLAP